MADAYNAAQAKHLSQLSTDLSNIPVKEIWDPRVRSHLFCLAGFSKGFTEQRCWMRALEEVWGCWAGMKLA